MLTGLSRVKSVAGSFMLTAREFRTAARSARIAPGPFALTTKKRAATSAASSNRDPEMVGLILRLKLPHASEIGLTIFGACVLFATFEHKEFSFQASVRVIRRNRVSRSQRQIMKRIQKRPIHY